MEDKLGDPVVGKKRVCIVIAGAFFINLVVMFLTHIFHVYNHYSQTGGFILTAGLCILLYRRYRWARWALIIYFTLNALLVILGSIMYAGQGMGALGFFYAPFVIAYLVFSWMLLSKDVVGYLKETNP